MVLFGHFKLSTSYFSDAEYCIYHDNEFRQHTFSEENYKKPTCSEEGYIDGQCETCYYSTTKAYSTFARERHVDNNGDGQCDNCSNKMGANVTWKIESNKTYSITKTYTYDTGVNVFWASELMNADLLPEYELPIRWLIVREWIWFIYLFFVV